MEGRTEQIKYKHEIAEQELKMKQAEEELLRLAQQTNQRLAEETARQEAIAQQQYREDLSKQIEYNKIIVVRLKMQIKFGYCC